MIPVITSPSNFWQRKGLLTVFALANVAMIAHYRVDENLILDAASYVAEPLGGKLKTEPLALICSKINPCLYHLRLLFASIVPFIYQGYYAT